MANLVEVGSLDRTEYLKARILYFERLSGQFFSFTLIASCALLCLAGWLFLADLLALSRQGGATLDAIVALPSFSFLLQSVFVIGAALVVLLAYSRAVDRADSRAIGRARILAGLVGLILIAGVLVAMSRKSIDPVAVLGMMLGLFYAPLRDWTGIAELVGLLAATFVLQYYYHAASSTIARLKPDEVVLVRESADRALRLACCELLSAFPESSTTCPSEGVRRR